MTISRYPVLASDETSYYLHPIHDFSLTALSGKDKWTAYRFTRNVNDTWMPTHFQKICSAINQLPPHLDLDTPSLSEATGFA